MFPKLSVLALLALLSSPALLILASPADRHRVEQRSHHQHVARNPAPANGSVVDSIGRSKRRRDTGSKAKRCAAKAASSSAALSTAAPTSSIPPIPNNAQVTSTSSSSDDPAPWTSSTSTTTTAAQTGPTGGGSSSGGMSGGIPISKLTGDITYYGTGLGACGITNVDTDYIAAASYLLFDTYPGYNYDGGSGNPNDNPLCGKKATLTYQGKTVTVTITDRCAGCEIFGSLDLSPSAFDQICDPAVGRGHGMTWRFDE